MLKVLHDISLVSLGVALAASNAQAQEGTPLTQEATSTEAEGTPDDTGLSEITVTARRVEESLQDIPVAVTAFSGEELRAQNVRTALDVQMLTPNLKIREAGGNPSALTISIRGQVQNDIISTLDPSIGVYVDQVYLARPVGINGGLLDIERVEVLKGPQGTLFGRNTTGGALNIITGTPDMDELSGSVRTLVGNFGRFDKEAVINIPIPNNNIAIRLAGQQLKSKGYGRDLVSGRRLAGNDSYTIRGKLRWQPTETLDIVLSGEHFDLDQSGPVQKPVFVSPTVSLTIPGLPFPFILPATPEIVAAISTGGCFDPSTFSCPGSYRPGNRTFASFIGGGFYDTSYNVFPQVKAKTSTASLNAALEIGDATLRYIGSYRKVDNSNPIDLDGTPFIILETTTFQSSNSSSHELQIAGNAFGNRLAYTAGVYSFRESGRDGSNTLAVLALNPNNPSNTLGFINNKSLAGYGQATYRLTDELSLTGGLRYSEDRKRLDSRSAIAGVCSVPVALRNNSNVPCSALFSRKDTAVSYTASADYRITPDVLVYVKTSKGFRGGGFNLRGTSVLSFNPFKPESVVDYEAGLKSEFLDRRVRFNAAVFTSKYQDIQKSTIVGNGSGGTATIVANAASARIKGGEAELTVLPVRGLRLGATLGITDPQYKSFPATCVIPGGPASGTPCDRSGEPFELVPKTTWSLSGQYTLPVGDNELSLRLDYSHTSKLVYQAIVFTQTPNLAPFVTQPGYGILNGRIAFDLDEPDVTIAVVGRNLTKKKYFIGALDFVNSGLGYIEAQPGVPREYGIEVSYRF